MSGKLKLSDYSEVVSSMCLKPGRRKMQKDISKTRNSSKASGLNLALSVASSRFFKKGIGRSRFNKNKLKESKRKGASSSNKKGKDSSTAPSLKALWEKSSPIEQNALLEYMRKNPKNKKVIEFMKKHYNISYNSITKKWETKKNIPDEKGGQRKGSKSKASKFRRYQAMCHYIKALRICEIMNNADVLEKSIVYFSPEEMKQEEVKSATSPQEKSYDTFVKKQFLPKNMRKVNLALFELPSRTNMMSLGQKLATGLPKERKNVIDMKYNLKKMKTKLGSDRKEVNQLIEKTRYQEKRNKFKIVSKKIFSLDDAINPTVQDIKQADRLHSPSPFDKNEISFTMQKTSDTPYQTLSPIPSTTLIKLSPCETMRAPKNSHKLKCKIEKKKEIHKRTKKSAKRVPQSSNMINLWVHRRPMSTFRMIQKAMSPVLKSSARKGKRLQTLKAKALRCKSPDDIIGTFRPMKLLKTGLVRAMSPNPDRKIDFFKISTPTEESKLN